MTWNPFNWTAEPFLALYATLAAAVFLVGFWSRATIGPAARMTQPLSELELAYLAGGARRLADAALLCLTSGGGASIDAGGSKITVTDQQPLATIIKRPPLLSLGRDMTRQDFQTAAKPLVERVQGQLQKLGYSPTHEQLSTFRLANLPFVAVLLAFGIAKAFIGSERGHPVGILIFLLVVTLIIGFILAKAPTRTRAGNEALKSYKASHARASRAPLDHELLLAVALAGPVVLSGTAYASVYAASKTMSSGDGGGGCGGGGGGGGCGGCS